MKLKHWTRWNWLDVWLLLGFALPHKTRKQVYKPVVNELKEDYVYTKRRKLFKRRIARVFLFGCFTFRTLLALVQCWYALISDKAVQAFLKAMPEPINEWWFNGKLG